MSDRAPTRSLGRIALAPWLALACSGDVVEGMTSSPASDTASDATSDDSASTASQMPGDTADTQCGDGVVQDGEDCDGEDLGEVTCQSLGFEDGIVTCSPNCRPITNACWTCGDESLHQAEICDGKLLRGETCNSQGYAGGTLACAEDCRSYDTSACEAFPTCGNGMLDPGEQCDGADLGGHTCQSHGFDHGAITCTATCVLDTSSCAYDESLDCGTQGSGCWSDSMCCPAGVGGNLWGKCYGFCT
jgi:hypothetical protein